MRSKGPDLPRQRNPYVTQLTPTSAEPTSNDPGAPMAQPHPTGVPGHVFRDMSIDGSRSGLPHELRASLEHLSGISLDDVQVHRNSARPARLTALAYTQGTSIHLAPGQEHQLAHEAWHVVQQKQDRVRPTLRLRGESINDSDSLETEADAMGARALRAARSLHGKGSDAPAATEQHARHATGRTPSVRTDPPAESAAPIQRVQPKEEIERLHAQRARPTTKGSNDGGMLRPEPMQKLNTASINALQTGTFRTEYATKRGREAGPKYTGFVKRPIRKHDPPTESTKYLGLAKPVAGVVSHVEDPRMVARSVASSRLDRFLGVNVLAEEQFYEGPHKGFELGFNVSGSVPGDEILDAKTMTRTVVDYSNPETQRTMSDLHVMDYLTGQTDRHAGNIVVDPATGRAKGIDNDQAFANPANEDQGRAQGIKMSNIPDLIDEATANKILSHKSKHIRSLLAGGKDDPERLTSEEVEAAVGRFKRLKTHLKSLKQPQAGGPAGLHRIVPEGGWGTDTFDHARRQDVIERKNQSALLKPRSYLGRESRSQDILQNPQMGKDDGGYYGETKLAPASVDVKKKRMLATAIRARVLKGSRVPEEDDE